MERIVQLTDYEYKRLKEQADATQATIEEGIKEGIKDACNLSVKLEMVVDKYWNDVITITPCVYVKSGFYQPSSKEIIYAISYDACRKINDHIEQWLCRQIRKRYKFDIDTINKYRDRLSNQWKINTAFLILSSSGWLAAVLTWIL